jgi:hypothetical protein
MFASLGGLFTFVLLALWLWALYDSITMPAERVRYLPKGVWVIIVLLLAGIGAIAWFIFGRPHAMVGTPGAGRQMPGGGSPSASRRRFIAPDDDPEFLRGLNKPKPDDNPRP